MQTHKRSSDVLRKHSDRKFQQIKTNKRKARTEPANEASRLRADLERFTGHGLLDCHAICDQRDAAVAERDRLRAELERADVLYQRACEVEHALRAELAEAECLEQARLLGKSGEREADLLGKLERAKADTARLDWLLDHSAQTHHSYSNPLGGGNYVQYHKDRAAIDAAMKP